MTIITDSTQYFLSSKDSKNIMKHNDTFNSNITFNTIDIIKQDSSILYHNIKISHCNFPYSFYIINSTNNILIVNDKILNVEFGNYNAFDLLKTINTLLFDNNIIATLSLNNSTGKYSLISSNNIQIKNSSMYKIIGLSINNTYTGIFNGVDYVINFDYPVNLLGILNLNIKTNLITKNYDSFRNNNNIIKTIPVNTKPYGLISYNNFENIESLIKNLYADELNIQITDDDDNLINFNSQDWSICIEIKCIKNMELIKFDINK